MPKFTRQEREQKMLRMAEIWVDMKRGVWNYDIPTDAQHDAKGQDIPNRKLILKEVGYTQNYPGANKMFWSNPQFLKMVEEEEAKRAKSVIATFADVKKRTGISPGMIAGTMVEMVWDRLKNKPETFSNDLLLKCVPLWLRLAGEIEGALPSGKQTNILTIVNDCDGRLPETAMRDVAETIRQYRVARAAEADIIDVETE